MYTYRFRKCNPERLPTERSLIRNVYEMESGEMHSVFCGQVLALFGEPDYVTKNNEDLFSLAVCGKRGDGEEVFLEIYYGPSGPAIAGGNEWSDRTAAFQLSELIVNTNPIDYEWCSIYQDVPVKVKMGVKNGKPYYKSLSGLALLLDKLPYISKIFDKDLK
ncbi:MAG: hypothetical protein IKK33_17855 [Lachnospiraceae bacterium]|nr:hypothetical protein [Lachnospiraceae bacterium]